MKEMKDLKSKQEKNSSVSTLRTLTCYYRKKPEHKKVNYFAYKKSMGHLNSKTHLLSVDSDLQVTTETESLYLKNLQGRQLYISDTTLVSRSLHCFTTSICHWLKTISPGCGVWAPLMLFFPLFLPHSL